MLKLNLIGILLVCTTVTVHALGTALWIKVLIGWTTALLFAVLQNGIRQMFGDARKPE